LHYYGKTDSGKEDAALANHLFQSNLKRTETDEEYKTRIRTDLQLAEKRIKEELGQQDSLLCFPYGYYNKTVIQVANELGINNFFTVDEGIADAKQKVIYRIHAGAAYISAEKMIETMQKYNE
jgi:biofilm PGA synthesis lipoprotein PgaB